MSEYANLTITGTDQHGNTISETMLVSRPPQKKRYMLWPIRLKRRKVWQSFFLAGNTWVGDRNGTRLYGWFVSVGPVKLVMGKPLEFLIIVGRSK